MAITLVSVFCVSLTGLRSALSTRLANGTVPALYARSGSSIRIPLQQIFREPVGRPRRLPSTSSSFRSPV